VDTVRETPAFARLKKRLFGLATGEVTEVGPLAALLAGCWREFAGGDPERICAGKLYRMETVRWHPPVLSFTMERHRAMGVGSTRAELQNWRVNLDRKIAQCERSRTYRQALPRSGAVKIEPIARELADNIIAGRADQWLK
jgi:hypothetical protein